MSQKNIIIATVALLALSFVSLAFIEQRAKDPNINKDWWAIYFQDPHGSSLDFTIENHSNSTDFTYEISQDNSSLTHESVMIPQGGSKNIPVDQVSAGKKTTISVWTDSKDKKEIYK